MSGFLTGRRRILVWLSIMGPGVVAASAGNDAGGIATYSSVGASYGYDMLWMLFIIAFSLAIVQEMCARMGAMTGKGLSDLIREQFGVRWTAFAMLVLLVANSTVTMSEFSGIAAAMEIFGGSRYLAVPVAAVGIWWMIVKGSYRRAERVFLGLALCQWAYVLAAMIVGPNWVSVGRAAFVPSFRAEAPYILLLIGAIGTTITPWMQFYLQSSIVDKGVRIKTYAYTRLDVYAGAVAAVIVQFAIIIMAGATLHQHGIRIQAAEDAALALAPLAGAHAGVLFSAGLLGASVLAAVILPLSTAYAVCEAFGFEHGVDRSFAEAPVFYVLYTALIVLGAGVVLLPNVSLINIMLLSQQINGILLPIVLVFMLALVNNRRIMRQHVNGRLQNILGWGTAIGLIVLTVLLMVTTAFPGLL